MKKTFFSLALLGLSALTSQAALTLVGIVDGTALSNGRPKAIVLQSDSSTDLSDYSIKTYNNGSSTPSNSLVLTGTAQEGQYIIIADSPDSISFFTTNFASSDFISFKGTAASINGDDAIELVSSSSVVDTYGVVGTDGTGESWEYKDQFAARQSGSAGAFNVSDWSISTLAGLDESGHTAALGAAFNNFATQQVPEPSCAALLTLGGVAFFLRRRR